MSKGPPRVTIEELEARWQFSKLKLVVVEGPTDQRYFRLLRAEKYMPREMTEIDVWDIGSIDVSAEHVLSRGFKGTGAKQRTVTLMRILEDRGAGIGYRGFVDRDFDGFVGTNHEEGSVIYTDYCSWEAGLWSAEVLRRLIVQFRADGKLDTAERINVLKNSIMDACVKIASLRIVQERNPDLNLALRYSERCLSLQDSRLTIDMDEVVRQSLPPGASVEAVLASINEAKIEFNEIDARMLCHGHDLLFVTTFAIRESSSMVRRLIADEHIGNAFLSIGMCYDHVMDSAAFMKLREWVVNS